MSRVSISRAIRFSACKNVHTVLSVSDISLFWIRQHCLHWMGSANIGWPNSAFPCRPPCVAKTSEPNYLIVRPFIAATGTSIPCIFIVWRQTNPCCALPRRQVCKSTRIMVRWMVICACRNRIPRVSVRNKPRNGLHPLIMR